MAQLIRFFCILLSLSKRTFGVRVTVLLGVPLVGSLYRPLLRACMPRRAFVLLRGRCGAHHPALLPLLRRQ